MDSKVSKDELPTEIDRKLRGYDLMLIETQGRYNGESIISECLVISKEYISYSGNRDSLLNVVDAIITEYTEFHEWKYRDKMLGLLNLFKDNLQTV